MDCLFAYRPTVAFDANIDDYAALVTEWEDERLYELTVSAFDDAFDDWIRTQTCETELIARVRTVDEDDTAERRFFSDVSTDATLVSIVEDETPGGDIRKYLSSVNGIEDGTITCGLFRTTEPHVTGFEPLSVAGVERLNNGGYCHAPDDQTSPTVQRLLALNDRLTTAFDTVECGVIGELGLDGRERFTADGLAVYGADDEVVSWVNRQLRSDEVALEYPDEFQAYGMGETPFDFGSVLRLKWV